jgi:predicted RNA-binding Zn-ribbon protein involved in translation (DUF1610 family)
MTGSIRRPDPDEPWRYRCPDCGSSSVHANYTDDYTTRPGDAAYACKRPCGWRGEWVTDAKTGERADPSGRGGSESNGGRVPRGASMS